MFHVEPYSFFMIQPNGFPKRNNIGDGRVFNKDHRSPKYFQIGVITPELFIAEAVSCGTALSISFVLYEILDSF